MVPFLASDKAAPPKRPFSPLKRSHALADLLDFRKIINTEENGAASKRLAPNWSPA
jgi:hypothetical protein